MKKKLFLLVWLFIAGHVIAQPPTISSFSPLSAKPGDIVTLTGTNFNTTTTNNIVFFGATRATVTAATSTSVIVTVPTGATFAPITLLNTGVNLMAHSISKFIPIYSPAKTNIIAADVETKVNFLTGSSPQSSAIADLDGDGKPDLVVANYNSRTVSIYRNTSSFGSITSSSFANKVDFSTGILLPTSIKISDIDRDGKLDLVLTCNGTGGGSISVFRNSTTLGVINANSFETRVDFFSYNADALAIGDIDGDGKPDLVINHSYLGSNIITIYHNTSNSGQIDSSSFGPAIDFTSSVGPSSIDIGDIDGDNKPDLIVTNRNSNTVSILRNTAQSGNIDRNSFETRIDFATALSPKSVSVGDLDGDGKIDLAIMSIVNDQGAVGVISILRNTATPGTIGSSSFSQRTDLSVLGNCVSFALNDLDGDGKVDIMINRLNLISFFKNTSIVGTLNFDSFLKKADFTTGLQPQAIAIGDLDGDSRPDLVITGAGKDSVCVLRNANLSLNNNLSSLIVGANPLSPVFTTNVLNYTSSTISSELAIRATTEDGRASIFYSINGGIYKPLNSGATSEPIMLDLGNNTINVKVVAQDGLTNKVYIVNVLRNALPTITSFSPASAIIGSTITITDSSVNQNLAQNTVYFGATKATVTSATSNSLTVTVPQGATYAPITVLNTSNNFISYSLSNFTPTFNPLKSVIATTDFEPKVDFLTGSNPRFVAIGDLDSDGKPDLVVANANSNTISLYRNISVNGSINSSSFGAKVDFTTGTSPQALAVGDLDGDGKLDLVVANNGSNTISVFLNTSTIGALNTSSFSTKQDFTTSTQPISIKIGDLDKDGKPDLVVANRGSNTISVFRNTFTIGVINSSSLTAKQDFTTGSSPISVVIGDLNRDSKPDIVVANTMSNNISIFRNTSTVGVINGSSFATRQNIFTGTGPTSISIGDLNRDEKLDLIVTNGGSSSISAFQNLSLPSNLNTIIFDVKKDFPTLANPQFVAMCNVAGDNNPDLGIVYSSSNFISLLRNTSYSYDLLSFATKVDFTIGSSSSALALGDLDGDGRPELVAANFAANSISILRNADFSSNANLSSLIISNGILNPSFTPSINTYSTTTTEATLTVRPSCVDVNAKIQIKLNGGNYVAVDNGTLSSLQSLNYGLNNLDVLVTAENGVTQKTYSLYITRNLPPSITSFTPIAAKPGDIVTLSGTNFNTTPSNNLVFFGKIKATILSATNTSLTVIVPIGAAYGPISVLNSDIGLLCSSSLNFIPTYNPSKVNISANDFGPKFNLTSGTVPSTVAVCDLDGDGKLDIIIASKNENTISIFRNTSTVGNFNSSSFAPKVDFATLAPATGVEKVIGIAINDLDGDGKLDLVLHNGPGSRSISIFRNTSTVGNLNSSSFAARVDIFIDDFQEDIGIADVDGDGKLDLVLLHKLAHINGGITTFTGSVSILRNTGNIGNISTNSFAKKVSFFVATTPNTLAIGDLNGDGKPEIVTSNMGQGGISILPNKSLSGNNISLNSFGGNVDFPGGGYSDGVAIGDLDGDGKSDISVTSSNSKSVGVFRNVGVNNAGIGFSSFAPKVDFAAFVGQGGRPYSAFLSDLNGDRKPEILTNHSFLDSNSIFFNTSTLGSITSTSFLPNIRFSAGVGVYKLAAINDLDGDSKPDLIFIGLNDIAIFRNTDVVLPVTITNLKAFQKDSVIQVVWDTKNELNLKQYEIEKSTDGLNFSKAVVLMATGLSSYQWLDNSPRNGINYYRLKIIDKDGSFKYSATVNVKIGGIKNIFKVAGNPVNGKIIKLQLENVDKGNYTLKVYNNIGQTVISKTLIHNGGSTTETISLGNISKGSYQLSILGNNVKEIRTIIIE